MKREWVLTIKIKNPFFYWMFKRRIKKAVAKWNADLEWINRQAVNRENGFFIWQQLVWQEINLWISIGDPRRPKEELAELVKRRGFSLDERLYLKDMMIHVGMWK